MRVAVLGAGAWGLALAIALERAHEVTLWTRDPAQVEALARTRQSAYLPGFPLPAAVRLEADASRAVTGGISRSSPPRPPA
jgi:glycerol-3-phosphate dehydrogenase (NAD(P)+)